MKDKARRVIMKDKTLSLNGAIDFVCNYKPKIEFKEEKRLNTL